MFRTRAVAHILAAGLATAACGSDSQPTAPDTTPTPSLRTEHNPTGPGAVVFHGHGQFFATVNEPGAPYFIAIGVSPAGAREFCRGGDPDFGASKDLFVEGPNGIHAVFKSDGKVPLLLYRPGTEDICDGSAIAVGTGLFTDNSSNLFGGHGRGVASGRIRGTVTTLAGQRLHVLVVMHSQLGPNGFEDLVLKIQVK
jgi:hypothetical protein